MLDIGFSKLLVIGGIALVVIGPERLPRVARMAGTLFGRAQRYVAEVKSEVNRSMELEELNKVRRQFETAAQDVHQSIAGGLDSATADINQALAGVGTPAVESNWTDHQWDPAPTYVRPDKRWRAKRGAVPIWYKRRQQIRTHVQSGAARVARFRPRRST
ncbi:MAG: Sec-independent protein translocase subunit TatB [Pseudomonadota bacterium]|jgi:sec-independent protein translocase protein TatB